MDVLNRIREFTSGFLWQRVVPIKKPLKVFIPLTRVMKFLNFFRIFKRKILVKELRPINTSFPVNTRSDVKCFIQYYIKAENVSFSKRHSI